MSEVNDEDEGDEDGSGEVSFHSPFEFSLMIECSLMILYGVWLVFYCLCLACSAGGRRRVGNWRKRVAVVT